MAAGDAVGEELPQAARMNTIPTTRKANGQLRLIVWTPCMLKVRRLAVRPECTHASNGLCSRNSCAASSPRPACPRVPPRDDSRTARIEGGPLACGRPEAERIVLLDAVAALGDARAAVGA